MLEQPSKLLNRHRRILTYGISRLNPKVAHKQNMALPGLHPMDNRDYTAAIQSRQQFLGRLGIDVTMLAFVEDPVDSEVYVVNRQDTIKHSNYSWDAPIRTDSLVTRECHVALPILFADCSPILLLDPASSALAVIHAGWHETMLNIAGNTVARMQAEFGTRPENLVAYIGPTICYEHYPRSNTVVEQELIEQFEYNTGVEAAYVTRGDKIYCSIADTNYRLLNHLGVFQIEMSEECTFESKNLPSARRDDPLIGGPFRHNCLMVAMLREPI